MTRKVNCEICGKEVTTNGLNGHKRFKHGVAAKPEDHVSLEDSTKLRAEVTTLNDSIKAKDSELAALRDEQQTEFATLHDEIATLNDKNKYLESNEYLKTYLLKLTPEAFDQLGVALFPERATVEDSKPDSTQDGAEAARDAHNVEVPGSIPGPATTIATDNKAPISQLADHVRAPEEYIFIGDKKEPGWVFYPNMGFSLKES